MRPNMHSNSFEDDRIFDRMITELLIRRQHEGSRSLLTEFSRMRQYGVSGPSYHESYVDHDDDSRRPIPVLDPIIVQAIMEERDEQAYEIGRLHRKIRALELETRSNNSPDGLGSPTLAHPELRRSLSEELVHDIRDRHARQGRHDHRSSSRHHSPLKHHSSSRHHSPSSHHSPSRHHSPSGHRSPFGDPWDHDHDSHSEGIHSAFYSAGSPRPHSPDLSTQEPQTIVTTWGPYSTEDLVISSPFYHCIEIPKDPLHIKAPNPDREVKPAVTLHAVHPVPRKYLRNLTESGHTDNLRYVGEQVDEKLFNITELGELLDNLEETLKRVNEVLEQAGGYHRVGERESHRGRILQKMEQRDAERYAEEYDKGKGEAESGVENEA